MPAVFLKIGELARRSGVSVRTLRHYDAVRLLVPSRRTLSGHRVYGADDIARLHRIRTFRQLGFALNRIAELLDDPAASPLAIVEAHLLHVREQAALQHRLLVRLEAMTRALRAGDESDADQLLATLETMTMWESKFSREQKEELRERARGLGPGKVGDIERGWSSHVAALRAAMEAGTDPGLAEVRKLVIRMRELTREFSGGDASIEATLTEAYRAGAGAQIGIDAPLRDYIARAARGRPA